MRRSMRQIPQIHGCPLNIEEPECGSTVGKLVMSKVLKHWEFGAPKKGTALTGSSRSRVRDADLLLIA